jgi:UDP-N-acetylmuramate: L-alanyl-gamma-D-glutamyl-meso-diaminopimelate ligase
MTRVKDKKLLSIIKKFMQKIHFISIGGAAMHNLAIVLKNQGHKITGSDDEIYEPSKSYLEKNGILPAEMGWNPANITADLDCVILGMHARVDNPELIKAQELGIKIYSYPEYIYSQSLDKQRIVIAGSHGKTTITSIIMHVLKSVGKDFDYMVGARIEGFETMAKLSNAPVIIIEGDEYLSSPIDRIPKFLHYHPHIVLISGIAWDHINVFPEFDEYEKQFELLADSVPKSGTIFYDDTDDLVSIIGAKERKDVKQKPYEAHPYKVVEGKAILITKHYGEVPLEIFGEHNMKNLMGAKLILNDLGVQDSDIYKAFASFKGAAKRLELLGKNKNTIIYKDFAHAPSKVLATTKAVKELYPKRKLVACLELHTFSSLNTNFLPEYEHTLSDADVQIVFYSPHTLEIKKLQPIDGEAIRKYFGNDDLRIFTNKELLSDFLKDQNWKEANLLMMSSGTFENLDFESLKNEIL